ncbi:MAG TPA: hypothetical protein VGP56_07285 [Gaiellaceae bacterium]|jgi:hypothetical protein|nr:hypothetical protein [Gaiellaceae bacterium]
MKRTLLLAAATAAVLALPATAAAFSGVAVAKEQARHSVVVASKGGIVRTVRAPGRLGSIRLGHGVTFSARRLSDGTFRATSIHSTGPVRPAVLRGIVVRNQTRLHRLLLTAGGTVLSVHAPARGLASERGPRAGDRVEVRVRVSHDGISAISLTTLGHSGTLELEGIFIGATTDTLRLAVEHRGEVFVAIPAGLRLPQLQPGDEIEAIVTVDAVGAFTLVSVQRDDENDDDHEGIGEDHGRVEVHGAITQLVGGTITVQSRGGSPVTCAVPSGTDLSGFKVTDRVEMRCANVNGTLTLTRLRRDDDDDDDGGHDGD